MLTAMMMHGTYISTMEAQAWSVCLMITMFGQFVIVSSFIKKDST